VIFLGYQIPLGWITVRYIVTLLLLVSPTLPRDIRGPGLGEVPTQVISTPPRGVGTSIYRHLLTGTLRQENMWSLKLRSLGTGNVYNTPNILLTTSTPLGVLSGSCTKWDSNSRHIRHYRSACRVSSDAQYVLSNPSTQPLCPKEFTSPGWRIFSESLSPAAIGLNLLKSDARSGSSHGTLLSLTLNPRCAGQRRSVDIYIITCGILLSPGDYVNYRTPINQHSHITYREDGRVGMGWGVFRILLPPERP